ncbi:MAG: PAS domain-containing sensor histidine kinase [Candidatus Kapabacteria bacterium]|nr:PAS domain-containing sensor histidine kinase [Candidatus Kapabacteria bacterium]
MNDEKTFYDTLDFLPDYAVVTDLLGNIHFISENVVESMSFRNKEELIGKSIINFVHKQERKRAIKLLAEYIITKTVDLDNHIMVESKTGRHIQLEVNIKPFINQKGNILLLHTLRDVTQRIELEQKLIESEKSFKNTVLNSPLGIYFYYLDENDDLILNGYNEAAERILNFDHKPLLNKKIEDAFPGLKDTEIIEIYKNVAKSGGKHFFEQIDYQDKSIKGAFEVRAYQTYENHMAVIFFDISERKKNEEEIKRLEREYRNIFDNAPYAIFQTTADGRFVRMNKEGANLLGYSSPEEMIQNIKSIRDEIYYNPNDRDRVIEALINSEGYVKLDIQFKKKTGEPIDTEMLARIVKNDSGEVVFLEGFVKDITKRKKAEAELRKIYIEQQTIFDSIPASIFYKDPNNKILRVNKAAAKLLQNKVKNIMGKSAEEFFPKHLADKFHKEDLKVIKTGKPLTGAIDKLIDKDGKEIWLKTDRIPYFDENGNITGVITISFDITQQYEAEEKVRKYLDYLEFLNKTALDLLKIKNIEEIYNYIIQGLKVLMPDCYAVVLAYNEETRTATVKAINENLINTLKLIAEDPNIVDNGQVWKISDRYLDLYKQAKLIKFQDSFEEIVKYNISPETAKNIRKKTNMGEIYVIGISKDDNLYGMVYIYPQIQFSYDYSKHVEAFMYQCALAIDQKIAEQKLIKLNAELEDRVKERTKLLQNTLDDLSAEINVRKVIEKELINAKLELTKALEKEKELNEMKSRFIDMISHEYRTPLTVILSSIYLIESYYESGDFNKVKKHTEKVKKSVDIMTNLIENVLTIGRGDSDKITIEKRWFDLDRILKEIIEEVIIVDKEQHPIHLKFKSEINQIYSDSRILRQILTNLILNAVKYSDTKMPVDIEVNNDLEKVEISIKDYGCGIPEEEINQIYDAFFRGKNQIGLTSGTGLGLTIVKRFIDMLEGEIFVESQLNKGTTFKIVIPSK